MMLIIYIAAADEAVNQDGAERDDMLIMEMTLMMKQIMMLMMTPIIMKKVMVV